MKVISQFKGQYRFLSNFWNSRSSEFDLTLEHWYQASKTLILEEQQEILTAKTASEAKRLGRVCTIREDFEDIKVEVMLELLRFKFSKYMLKKWLLSTGDAYLVEGNDWGDRFYGVDLKTCKGDNVLGILLMLVREELKMNSKMEETKELTGILVKARMDSAGYNRKIWLKCEGGCWDQYSNSVDILITELQKVKEWWEEGVKRARELKNGSI
jgi:N-glycosidase YbiA